MNVVHSIAKSVTNFVARTSNSVTHTFFHDLRFPDMRAVFARAGKDLSLMSLPPPATLAQAVAREVKSQARQQGVNNTIPQGDSGSGRDFAPVVENAGAPSGDPFSRLSFPPSMPSARADDVG